VEVRSAECSQPFVALVDLKDCEELPDVFIVPSNVIATYFEGRDPAVWRRARYHELGEELSQYRNNWEIIRKRLSELNRSAAAVTTA
jgi:hypothetical protein